MTTRRGFLATAALPLVAGAQTGQPRHIAAIVTEYRHNSHADVIIGKYLEGFRQDGRPPGPRSKIVSLYTAQVPKNDMSRAMAKKHNVPIYPTIWEALTLGGDRLAVDGVLLIGEHGDYPWNEKGQHLYPRYELFLEITDAFRATGKSVPVFSDKHLSYSWHKALRMVEISHELKFPLMAGSSIPVAYRPAGVDLEWGAKAKHAVSIFYGDPDAYGFHLLEGLQCMVERRRGGETGVRAVQYMEKQAMWEWVSKTPWAEKLLNAALAQGVTRKPGDIRELGKDDYAYRVEYRDGLEAAAFMMNGVAQDACTAVEVEGRAEPVATLMWLEEGRPFQHFACLVQAVEKMFETGKPTYPVERTLLTSGILESILNSKFEGQKRIETPHLAVKYQAPRQGFFCTTKL
ncbi:MAG TPA: hypothetical protein VG672_03725 [Bryobacteraceae bacterium]|nr:hypothetical protein [Bryobacteraceae bacterium]